MVDYSLDIVEVDGERRAERGKTTGRKSFLELEDGSRVVVPADAARPEGARDLLESLDDLYPTLPSPDEIRDRVLARLRTGRYELAA